MSLKAAPKSDQILGGFWNTHCPRLTLSVSFMDAQYAYVTIDVVEDKEDEEVEVKVEEDVVLQQTYLIVLVLLLDEFCLIVVEDGMLVVDVVVTVIG